MLLTLVAAYLFSKTELDSVDPGFSGSKRAKNTRMQAPNRYHWWVISIAAIIAFGVLTAGEAESIRQPFVIVLGAIVLGSLLIWQSSRKH